MSARDLSYKIAKALSVEGTHSPEDIRAACEADRMQAWAEGDSLVVTEIKSYPQLKECFIVLAAGNLDEVWKIIGERIEPWARDHGCRRIKSSGRQGWEVSARAHGYGQKVIAMKKELV